jgi:hypothetical protein
MTLNATKVTASGPSARSRGAGSTGDDHRGPVTLCAKKRELVKVFTISDLTPEPWQLPGFYQVFTHRSLPSGPWLDFLRALTTPQSQL